MVTKQPKKEEVSAARTDDPLAYKNIQCNDEEANAFKEIGWKISKYMFIFIL